MAIQQQLQIPIYPVGSKNISACLAVNVRGETIEYIANGLNVFSHHKEDYNQFRFVTCNFIEQGLCRQVDVQRCFGISESNVKKYLTKLGYRQSYHVNLTDCNTMFSIISLPVYDGASINLRFNL